MKDDDVVWVLSYSVQRDIDLALPLWKHSPGLAEVIKGGARFDFVSREDAERRNSALTGNDSKYLDEQLTARWSVIMDQRKSK